MKEIVVIAPLRTLPGKGPELEKLFKEIIPLVKQEKGTLEYAIYKKEDDPDKFIIYEKYVDKDAITYHLNTPYFQELGKKLAPLIGAPADIKKIGYWVPVE